jgi:Mn-dependent DtxR family transcriptional regulator
MKNALKQLASLRMLLAEMEQEVGLREIGSLEKSVLMSIADLAKEDHAATTKEILQHSLNTKYSRPSVFRALKTLEELKMIKKSGTKRGFYSITDESTQV